MPRGDIVENSDICRCYQANDNCGCGCNHSTSSSTSTSTSANGYCYCPPQPPVCPPPYWPPYPWSDQPAQVKKTSTEAQICKLSRKAATIKELISKFVDKNKPAIIKIDNVSYNFGTYKTITTTDGVQSEEDSAYGETILGILQDELAAIKAKMKELTDELDAEDDDTTTSSSVVEATVTQ